MRSHVFLLATCIFLSFLSCKNESATSEAIEIAGGTPANFILKQEGDQIQVFAEGGTTALVTQNAKADFRPYLHPILAPNSEVALTQFSPGHHKHQTGLYWGFTRVNGTGADEATLKKWFYNRDKTDEIKQQIGRDFFHFPEGDHWQKIKALMLIDEGEKVKWQTIYNMLDAKGTPILEETQTWTFHAKDDKHLLELEWKGKALNEDVTINQFDYGGLFLRMPWHKDIEGEAVNAARQKNNKAEGQRAMWVDVGMAIEGLDEWGHIAIFDHPDNAGFPNHWRVDGQLGIGPIRAKKEDWTIKKDQTVTIRNQVVAYTGKLNDVDMNDTWAAYVKDDGMYNRASLWGIAQQEGKEAKFLSPEAAIASSTIKEGYKMNMYASEPMITQPMAFCWDDKGRMWIAENRDYENRREGFSNDGTSRILILEDTDKDGVADTKKVFADGIPFPAAIAVGFDGLYLGAPPNFLFLPDKNKDDKVDKDAMEILLTGWGIRDRHETINSLHWGPDGWLYGLEGFATPSKIRKPKGKGKFYKHKDPFPEDLLEAEGVDINGGVWRWHPTKEIFEVVAHGFSNPWGIDYDAKGQLFISACVIPHLFHIIPGGIYHRQGGRHFNPYVYKDIQTIVDHRHRSAHGGARVYLSDAFPDDQYGRIFMANIHEHAVLSDVLHKNGSGYTASHGEDFMLANNAQWIGFSMEIGPEGGLYVLDWHDADICGNSTMHKETGRVFRITPDQSLAENWEGRYADLNTFSDKQLVELQTSKSSWHARRARVILQYRASKNGLQEDAVTALNDLFASSKNEDIRLQVLWTKQVTQQTNEVELLNLLKDNDPYIRAWSIQFITEDKTASSAAIQQLTDLAKNESHPVVRLYLATALQRMELDQRWGIAEALAQQKADTDDPNIPYMLWFAVEPLVASNPQKAVALAKVSELPMLSNHIARRLVDADEMEVVAKASANDMPLQADFLNGILSGLEGRSDIKEPAAWEAAYKQLQSNAKLSPIALQIAQQFGSASAAKELLAVAVNEQAAADKRKEAITSLAGNQRKELESVLPTLMNQAPVRQEAIRAISAFDNEDLGDLLLKKYNSFNLAEKQEAIQTLASRPSYGWGLAVALKDKKIARKDIPPYIALQLKRVVGNGFVEIWGPIDEVDTDIQADFAKYQRLLHDKAVAAANPSNGRFVFQRTCWSCHKMYEDGGNLGPDLTGSNRANIGYLLSNILDPSGEIQDDYKMVVLTTQDGRTISGNITAESERQLTLRTINQDALVLNKSDIQTREQTEKSIMPEGLLNTLTEEEVLDLMAYMRTVEQVELKEEVVNDD